MGDWRRFCVPVLVASLAGCAGLPGSEGQRAGTREYTEAAQINFQLGVGYLQTGRFEIAREKLLKALEFDPRMAEAYNALGVLYEEMGETEAAEANFGEAVRVRPDYTVALMNHARLQCLNGYHGAGEQRFLDLAAGRPEIRAAAYTGAGVCMVQSGSTVSAESYFRQALDLDPGMALALLELTEILYAQGQFQQARGFLQRYHDVAGFSPRSLLLGVNIARALDDAPMVSRYSELLRSRFADSREARRLIEMAL